jgi:hypothetical protein
LLIDNRTLLLIDTIVTEYYYWILFVVVTQVHIAYWLLNIITDWVIGMVIIEHFYLFLLRFDVVTDVNH